MPNCYNTFKKEDDEMTKVILLCAGGMSTSLLMKKIEAEANNNNFPLEISAHGIIEDMKILSDSDLVLLAPHVRYVFDKLISDNPNINLQLIDMKDYGLMNGKKFLIKF